MTVNAELRRAVRQRASHRCEYCQREEINSAALQLQIEHVVPRKHGGGDEFGNLALACAACNLHKGSDLTGIDPISKTVTALFNPRRDEWVDHFLWIGPLIVGRTPTGRTTVRVLQLNSAARVKLRLKTDRQ